jgi:hemoglobin/transferrin/lactoferrin receptor protein
MPGKISVYLLLLFPLSLHSQIVRVTGQQNNEILELVSITSEDPRASVITNSRGQADLSQFRDAGVIEFRMVGYNPLYLSYRAIEGMDFQVKMSRAMVNLDEVIVSATRWSQKTSEIPIKVITISPSAITMQNPQTAADLLGISGKVFIQKSQQGGGSPMIRGFATNRLLYSVDGIRMNTAIFRGGNIQNVISLDPFAIEHTEVLFGPGSVIYGSDAIGGVMSFRTLVPQFSLTGDPHLTGRAVARYSTASNERTGHFDINIGWKKWASVTSISTSAYDDLRMGNHGPEEYRRPFYVKRIDGTDVVIANDDPDIQRPSGYSQVNIMQKIRYSPAPDWDLQYGFHYSTTTGFSRYDRHIQYRNGIPRYAEWEYGPQVWMMNNLEVTHSPGRILYDRASLRVAWQRFEESRISRNLNADWREIRMEEVDAWSVNLDLLKSTGGRNKIFYGMEGVVNIVQSQGTDENILSGSRIQGPARYPQSTWATWALYVSDQYHVTEKITLEAGARYTLFKLLADFDTTFYPFPFTTADLNNGALTGSTGMVYRPGDSWVLSINLSTAFRSPNVDDVGKVFDSEPGSVTVPNPDLRAEYAWNIDAGLAKVIAGSVKIDLTGYYTYLDNALVRRDYMLSGMDSIFYNGELSKVQAIQNAARARVFGIQAGMEIKLPVGFGLMTDLNLQKGEEELDDGSVSPSRHAPPWFGSTRLNYASGKLEMQLYGIYCGEKSFEEMPMEETGKAYLYAMDSDGNPYAPAWATLNLKAAYRLNDEISFAAGLENITDRRYRTYSSGISAPGRNYIMSVQVKF